MDEKQNGSDMKTLQATLAAERDARATACQAAMQKVLAEFNCEMHPIAQITRDGRIVANVAIVALEVT